MKKKLITLVFAVIFANISFSQITWYTQNSGVNRELTDVCFVDQNNGWISGWTETMLHTTNGGVTWIPQNILPNNAYFSVFFTDTLNGWASGYAGKIVHTSDGGQTWIDQSAPVNTDYYRIYFFNSDIGWIIGGDAGGFPSYIPHRVILHTTNGGNSWSAQYSQAYKSLLRSITFVDQNNGFATGESGVIMKTTDGGSNWSEQVIPSFHFYDIFFIDNLTGWVTGEYLGLPHYSAIFKTTDGGASWNETQFGTNENLSSVYFTDSMKGWAVGGNDNPEGIVYYTSDGGTNWALKNIPSVNFLYRVFFFDENSGWASGHLGTIIATENSVPVELTSFTASANENNVTLNWQTATETNNSGFEIERKESGDRSQETGWEKIGFVEGNGTTTEENQYSFVDKNLKLGSYSYKLVQIDFDGTRNESETVNVKISNQPAGYSLSQNYPNPFNPSTTIQFSIPESGNVKISLFNSLGELKEILVDDYKQAGSFEVNFDAKSLPSGVYYYKLDAGNFTTTRKMILLK